MELIAKVLDYSNIQKAYKQVTSNKGSRGVDGVTTAQLQDYMQENWTRIKQEIIKGTYKPKAVLGVEIPKSSTLRLSKPKTFIRYSNGNRPFNSASRTSSIKSDV